MTSCLPEKYADVPMLTVAHVVELTDGISDRTIRRWIRDGVIKSIKFGPSMQSHIRIPRSEVERILSGALFEEAEA